MALWDAVTSPSNVCSAKEDNRLSRRWVMISTRTPPAADTDGQLAPFSVDLITFYVILKTLYGTRIKFYIVSKSFKVTTDIFNYICDILSYSTDILGSPMIFRLLG